MTVQIEAEGWLGLFSQMRAPGGFMSRFFTVKPGGIYNGKKVGIDIERFEEDVAIAIQAFTGVNLNDVSNFTTKEFEPPAFGEGFPLNVDDLINREAGTDPFDAGREITYGAQVVKRMAKGFQQVDHKIKRSMELQASQALQVGVIDLINKAGDTVYTIDYKPKAAHFPTVGVTWGAGGDDPLADVLSLLNLIRTNGKIQPDMALFGETAFDKWLSDTKVKERLDNRRFNLGEVRPELDDSGAVFQGFIWIGSYRIEMWTYPETFKHPQTGVSTRYLEDDKVVVMASRARRDTVSAKVPPAFAPDPRVAQFIPPRMNNASNGLDGNGFDVTPNVYASLNGKQLIGELESRSLVIPVQIDGHGCIDTVI